MVWGGKGANATWFTANPEAVHGINWLPVHGGSLYLGLYPDYVEKNYRALVEGIRQRPIPAAGRTCIWMYRALTEANDAARLFEARRSKAKTRRRQHAREHGRTGFTR